MWINIEAQRSATHNATIEFALCLDLTDFLNLFGLTIIQFDITVFGLILDFLFSPYFGAMALYLCAEFMR
jgi:hypothetical protein